MALTGLQIHKLLPGTNCKECGSNTCLAFAMKLAAQKADLALCPYASDKAKEVLGAAAEPPMRGLKLGPAGALRLGEETVLYRHDKTFVHPTALAVAVRVSESAEETEKTLSAVKAYLLERVGERFSVDMVAVVDDCDDAPAFVALAERAFAATGLPLILRAANLADPAPLITAAAAVKGSGSVLYAASPELSEADLDALIAAARDNGHALALTAADPDSLVRLSETVRNKGFLDLLLSFQTHGLAETFQTNTIARRAAIKDSVKLLGHAPIRFARGAGFGPDTVEAVTEIAKYGGVFVLPSFDPAQLSVLMTLRLNLFTDPRKPIQVEPGVYPVGEPGPNSPVFVTTNFSLTYFLVSGEIENTGLSAWLAVPDCEGMSVLTAWAAGKFSGALVAKFLKENGIGERLEKRVAVIPGYAAVIRGEMEEGLPGWDILVGPQEAGDMESFVKARFS